MLKSDFTKKLIEQFEVYIKEIDENKNSSNYDKSLDLIDECFSSLFRINSMFFNSMSDENLIEILKSGGVIEKDKTIIIAKLLEEKAIIYSKLGKESDCFYIYLKSLNLFIEAFLCPMESDLTRYFNDILLITDKIKDFEIPNNIKTKLLKYYIEAEKYCNAEDMLYEIIDDCPDDNSIIQTGIKFYEFLLTKDDESLLKGNLPRDEVEDGLTTLKKKLH